VINLVSLPAHENVDHLVFGVFIFFFSVIVSLFKSGISYLLLCNILFIILFAFLLFVAFKLYVSFLLVRHLTAANLCCKGCQESLEIIVSIVVGFLHISNEKLRFP
jgi:hypothetical protein